MLIETFTVGGLSTNCYVVGSHETKDAIIIDPGIDLIFEADQIIDYIDEAGLKIKLIVNTHGHSDHINGDAIFQEKYNVPICIHRLDADCLAVLENINFPATVLLDDGSYNRVRQRIPESYPYAWAYSRQHLPSGGPIGFHWRHLVCRRNRQNRFSRRLRQRHAGVSSKTAASTREPANLPRTWTNIDDWRRKKGQPIPNRLTFRRKLIILRSQPR